MKKTSTDEAMSEYKRLIKKVKNECRKARKATEKRLMKNRKTNPKAFYSYISRRTKVKASIGPLRVKTDNGMLEISDDKDVADEQNRYFASVFRNNDKVEPLPAVCPLESPKVLLNVEFTPENVEKAIASFRIDTSPGPDGVNARTLKCLSTIIAPAIATILTKTMKGDKIPND